jgi:hypothetical protein
LKTPPRERRQPAGNGGQRPGAGLFFGHFPSGHWQPHEHLPEHFPPQRHSAASTDFIVQVLQPGSHFISTLPSGR